MSLELHVDRARWRAHLEHTMVACGGPTALIPVIKGNGYGLGLTTLAEAAAELGVDVIAVGQPEELTDIVGFTASPSSGSAGRVVVLQPWRPDLGEPFHPLACQRSPNGPAMETVIRTVSDISALRAAPADSVILLELGSAMRRFGIDESELAEVARLLASSSGPRCVGLSIHLPLVADQADLDTIIRAVGNLTASGARPAALWVSHLTDDQARTVGGATGLAVRRRVGTRLWLGDPGALQVRAQVLAVHPMARGERFGYRRRATRAAGHLLVVSGGTAHGIGLEAPPSAATPRTRARVATLGLLGAAGRTRSPFTVNGSRCDFAESPHMQVSMLWLPTRVSPPPPGEYVSVQVRHTTTAFDTVVFT